MLKVFRVTDCTRHLGIPIKKACIIFCISSCSLCGFTLFFLPIVVAISLIIAEVIIGIIGLFACCSRFRILTMLYLVGQSILLVPVWVVNGYIIYTLSTYNEYDCNPSYYGPDSNYCMYYWESTSYYQRELYTTTLPILWLALMTGLSGTIVSCLSLTGFRKWKMFQLRTHDGAQNTGPATTQQPMAPTAYQPQPFYTVPQIQQPVHQMPGPYQNQQGIPQSLQTFPPQQYLGPAYPLQGFEPPPAYTEPELVSAVPPVEEPKRNSIYA